MTFKTYLKNRQIVEERWKTIKKDEWFGYCFIDELLKGIRNKHLFYALYLIDKGAKTYIVVSSIDKHERFFNIFKAPASRIKINPENKSEFDKYEDSFNNALKSIKRTFNNPFKTI